MPSEYSIPESAAMRNDLERMAALQAEIARLRKERDRFVRFVVTDTEAQMIGQFAEEINRLSTENAELRRDAGRYRYIRLMSGIYKHLHNRPAKKYYLSFPTIEGGATNEGVDYRTNFDGSIDASIKAHELAAADRARIALNSAKGQDGSAVVAPAGDSPLRELYESPEFRAAWANREEK